MKLLSPGGDGHKNSDIVYQVDGHIGLRRWCKKKCFNFLNNNGTIETCGKNQNPKHLWMEILHKDAIKITLSHPSSTTAPSTPKDGKGHRIYIILDGYPASLRFPIMHQVHVIYTQGVIAIT